MISVKILDIKEFMSNLLIKTTFDNFLLSEFLVVSFNEFKITGRLHKEWYNKEEQEELGERDYSKWNEIKPIVYQLVKGNKSPLFMKVVFLLSIGDTRDFLNRIGKDLVLENIDGLFLNLRYEKRNLYLTTGISVNVFTFDKTLEREWDAEIEKFLKNKEIAFEQL